MSFEDIKKRNLEVKVGNHQRCDGIAWLGRFAVAVGQKMPGETSMGLPIEESSQKTLRSVPPK